MTSNLLKLLIVDDSEPVRTSLLSLLDSIPGIDVVFTAGSLAESLASVQLVQPTLVVLDMHLPDGNAIGAIGEIKRLAPGVRIVMFTNDPTDFHRRKCLQAGGDWFLDKSSQVCDLLEVVRQHTSPDGSDTLFEKSGCSTRKPGGTADPN